MSHGNNDSAIGRHYVSAVETRSRVATSLLSDVIGHLEKLITACQQLRAVLAVDLIEDTTSVPGQIQASVNTVVQKTHDSLLEFKSQIADKFVEYYEQNIDFLVTKVIKFAKNVLSYKVYFADAVWNDTDSFDIGRMEKIFDDAIALCKEFEAIHDSFTNSNFSANLLVDRTCVDAQMLYWVCYWPSLTRNDTDYVESLVARYRSLERMVPVAFRCFPMYRTLVYEVQSWLKSALTEIFSLPLQRADRRYILVDLEQELDWLKSISRTFAEESMVRTCYDITSFSVVLPPHGDGSDVHICKMGLLWCA